MLTRSSVQSRNMELIFLLFLFGGLNPLSKVPPFRNSQGFNSFVFRLFKCEIPSKYLLKSLDFIIGCKEIIQSHYKAVILSGLYCSLVGIFSLN